jgi:hypothetical protein
MEKQHHIWRICVQSVTLFITENVLLLINTGLRYSTPCSWQEYVFLTIVHLTSRQLFMVIVLDMESPKNSQTSFICEGLGALELSTFTLVSGVSV